MEPKWPAWSTPWRVRTAGSTSWSTQWGGSTIIERAAAAADELTLAEWHRVITFNLDGTFLFCNAVVPVMKRQRAGKIVNISSIAGRGLATNSSGAYAAAKGGIIAFTRKLSLELGLSGSP
jgi:NAD(P)-dependent dehydrogenase (short-subunit alcohol dehydrogenase family)